MRYIDLALVVGIALFGFLGFMESLSVGNFTFAALSLGAILFARLYLSLFTPPSSPTPEEGEEEK